MERHPVILSIAGSDCSGGAGIQADIKAITMNGVYASSVITALTAQNTTGVYGILETPADFIAAQMDAVFSDIFPDAVKIGMLPSPEAMECVAAKLCQYNAETGEPMGVLYEEMHPKYVEPQNPIVFLPWDPTKFIYQSQRDGYNHLYLFETNAANL